MAKANPNSLSGGVEDHADAIRQAHEYFEETYEALRGFQLMLGCTLEEYGNKGKFSYGISALLRQKLDDLQEVRSDVFDLIDSLNARLPDAPARQEYAEPQQILTPEARIAELIRTSSLAADDRPAWHDLDAIAAKSCVQKGDVARVLFVLTGEDHAGPAYAAYDGNLSDGLAAHLLSMLINRTLAHGDIWGQVSTATGIDLMDLQRILEAMLAYVPRKQAITLAEKLDRQEPTATELREAMIAAQLRDGVEPGIIAQALNLRKSAVDKVAAKLTAEAQDTPPAAKAG